MNDSNYNKTDLPRSIFVSQEDPRKALRMNIDRVLSDKFMVLIALLMLPIILLPMLWIFLKIFFSFLKYATS